MDYLFKPKAMLVGALTVGLSLSSGAFAAEQTRVKGASALLLEEVLVKARKKSKAEEAQDVPVALTAFSGEQLEALQMRNLSDLTYSMPNVALDGVGTSKGTANFTIRGLGINSSIPSVDPTVGVFVDGMYYGMSWGIITDTFDLEAMEVLRGPQGLLFGRNVTGGAVSMRTRRPSHDFDMRAKVSVTDDNDQVYAFSVTDSLIEDVLAGKISMYYRDDNGYFDNIATNNDDFGESETYLLRPSVTWTPTEDLELTFLYERGELEGDGAPAFNAGNPSLSDFELDIDNEGNNRARWNHIIWETNYNIAFGDGVVTNIMAYRDFEQSNDSDIDAANIALLNLGGKTEQNQFSNELRYAGTFVDGMLDITVGTFYFSQNQTYVEERSGAAANQTFGGDIDHETWAVFAQGDYRLTDALVLTLGARYTKEEKEADIARGVNGTFPCVLEPSLSCVTDFTDDDDWSSFTPKFGLQWFFNESSHAYFTYTKGFRSGGYNLRNTSLVASPGPYDQEEQNAYELGMKSEWWDGRVKLNLAVFHNEMEDMQRETIYTLPNDNNPIQEIRNTADATIQGAEMELQVLATDNLLLSLSAGYIDGEYDKVTEDINRDLAVDENDKKLDLPRLAPWSWQAGANYDVHLDNGLVSLRANYNHRSSGFWNDSNRDTLNSADLLDAGMSYSTADGKWTATLFGKNLLDNQVEMTRFTLGAPYVFAPINKGRVVGVELQYQY